MTQLQYPIHVLRRLDDRLILEYRGDDGMCDRASGRKELFGQKGNIIGDGKKRQDRLV